MRMDNPMLSGAEYKVGKRECDMWFGTARIGSSKLKLLLLIQFNENRVK